MHPHRYIVDSLFRDKRSGVTFWVAEGWKALMYLRAEKYFELVRTKSL